MVQAAAVHRLAEVQVVRNLEKGKLKRKKRRIKVEVQEVAPRVAVPPEAAKIKL